MDSDIIKVAFPSMYGSTEEGNADHGLVDLVSLGGIQSPILENGPAGQAPWNGPRPISSSQRATSHICMVPLLLSTQWAFSWKPTTKALCKGGNQFLAAFSELLVHLSLEARTL